MLSSSSCQVGNVQIVFALKINPPRRDKPQAGRRSKGTSALLISLAMFAGNRGLIESGRIGIEKKKIK